jgi:hypothetical protein
MMNAMDTPKKSISMPAASENALSNIPLSPSNLDYSF